MPATMASLATLSNQLASASSFNPSLQPTVQLVSHSAPGAAPPGLAPPPVHGPAQPPPFQTIYSPVSEVTHNAGVENRRLVTMLAETVNISRTIYMPVSGS